MIAKDTRLLKEHSGPRVMNQRPSAPMEVDPNVPSHFDL